MAMAWSPRASMLPALMGAARQRAEATSTLPPLGCCGGPTLLVMLTTGCGAGWRTCRREKPLQHRDGIGVLYGIGIDIP